MPTVALQRFAPALRYLHWLSAVLVLGLLAVGFSFDLLEGSPWRDHVRWGHKIGGTVLLGLLILRVRARLKYGRPPLLGTPLTRSLSRTVHTLLYGVMTLQVLDGLAFTGVLGLFTVPAATKKYLWSWHEPLAWGLVALIALHVAGTLYHKFVVKDETLERMW